MNGAGYLMAPPEATTLLKKRRRNSSRTVETWKIVSGERPRERQPSHFGVKSTHGMMWLPVTSRATLNEVLTVQ